MRANRFELSLSAATLLVIASPAAAQSYSVAVGSGSWSSIASTGTSLGLAGVDDGDVAFSAPSAFPFFGQTVPAGTALYVNSNGTLSVGSSYSDYGNTSIPTAGGPSRFMAPLWTDLRFGSLQDAYYREVGSEIVVEWDDVENYSVTGETISFQIRIATGTGVIRYVYGPRVGGSSWPGASVGLEDGSETLGAQASCSPSCTPTSLPNGTVVTFTPGSGPGPTGADLQVFGASSPGTVNAGETISVPFLVENRGTGLAAATRVALVLGTSAPVSASDSEIASAAVPALSPSEALEDAFTVTIPSGFPGTFAVGIVVDPQDAVAESNEANNVFDMGSITINGGGSGGITIVTEEIPAGTVGIPYDVTLQTSGGASPAFSLIEGSLPPGLSLGAGGRISGTPDTEGEFFFGVQATQSGLTPGQAFYEVVIANGGSGGITVTPTSLPDARVGVPYAQALSATGGAPPYAFQVISGRPEWLTVNGQGMMSGTPDGPGEYSMTVSVFDSEFADSTAVIALRVLESGPVSVLGSVPNGVTGRAYAQPVVRGGIPPYQVAILDGAFPAGFGIDDQGVLGGTATEPGRWQVTIQVTDSNTPPGMAAGAVVLEVAALEPLEILVEDLQIPTFADADVAIPVRGGIPPYSWSIVQGSLPGGLALNSMQGRITGRIEEVTTSTITFRVQDSEGTSAERAIVVLTKRQRNVEGGGAGRGSGRGGCVCVAEPSSGAPAGAVIALGALLWGLGPRARRRRRRAEPGGDPGGAGPG